VSVLGATVLGGYSAGDGPAGTAVPVSGTVAATAASGTVVDVPVGSIDAVLATMTTALRTGDEDAFVSVVDPAAPSLRVRQRSVFRGLRALKASDLLLERKTGRPSSAGKPFPTGTVVVAVHLSYTLAPWDPGPVSTRLAMAFTPHPDGTWLLRSTTDDGPAWNVGPDQYLEPWLLGDLDVVRRGHVLLVGESDAHRANTDLADELERATVAVRRIWPERTWNGRVVAFAVRDEDFLDAWFDGRVATSQEPEGSDPATFDAQVTSIPSDADDGIGVPRMAIAPYLVGGDDDGFHRLLLHEITHVALLRIGRGDVPTWLEEGVAEYTGWGAEPGGGVDAVEGLEDRGLPDPLWDSLRGSSWEPDLLVEDLDFYEGSGDEVGSAYASAWLTCLYIADRYGAARLRALYRAAASRPSGEPAQEVERAVLRSVLGTDRRTLRSRAGAFARDLRGEFV